MADEQTGEIEPVYLTSEDVLGLFRAGSYRRSTMSAIARLCEPSTRMLASSL
jgi:hypothetical protein